MSSTKSKSNQIIVDKMSTDSTPLKVVESVDTPTGEYTNGVLCTLEGPLSDFSKPTRNNRWYSGELWRGVLNSDYFQEMMETNTLFGEPDHPMEVESRDDIHLPYVSHAIRDVYIDEERQMVVGKLDILDTPYGRIIKTLVDYGAVLGVSSRGNGMIINTEKGPTVDPNEYRFITWDIVAYPSNDQARQVKVNESKDKSLYENLISQVDNMLDKNTSKLDSLQLTKSLIENSGVPEKNDLLTYINESIKSIKGSDDDIEESESVEDKSTDTNRDDISKDLQEALDRIVQLRDELDQCKVTITELELSNKAQADTITEYEKRDKKLTRRVEMLMDQLSQTVVNGSSQNDDVSLVTEEVTKQVVDDVNESLHQVVEAVAIQMMRSEDSIKDVIEESITRKVTKVEELLEDLAYEREKSNESYQKSRYDEMKIDELEEENAQLVDTLEDYEEIFRDRDKFLSELKESYAQVRCNQLGVDPTLVRPYVDQAESPREIDEVIRKAYRSKEPARVVESESLGSRRLNEGSEGMGRAMVVNESQNQNEAGQDIVSILNAMKNI